MAEQPRRRSAMARRCSASAMLAPRIASAAHVVQFDVSGLATLVSLNVIGKVTGSWKEFSVRGGCTQRPQHNSNACYATPFHSYKVSRAKVALVRASHFRLSLTLSSHMFGQLPGASPAGSGTSGMS